METVVTVILIILIILVMWMFINKNKKNTTEQFQNNVNKATDIVLLKDGVCVNYPEDNSNSNSKLLTQCKLYQNTMINKDQLKNIGMSSRLNMLGGIANNNNIHAINIGANEWDVAPAQQQGQVTNFAMNDDNMCAIYNNNDIYCSKQPGQSNPKWNKLSDKLPSGLKNISISNNSVCGTNTNDNIFCASDISNTQWRQLSGGLRNVSLFGQQACGTNSLDNIWCTPDVTTAQTNWNKVSGQLRNISLRNKQACGTNANNDIYCTNDITNYNNPNWQQITDFTKWDQYNPQNQFITTQPIKTPNPNIQQQTQLLAPISVTGQAIPITSIIGPSPSATTSCVNIPGMPSGLCVSPQSTVPGANTNVPLTISNTIEYTEPVGTILPQTTTVTTTTSPKYKQSQTATEFNLLTPEQEQSKACIIL